ncbi:Fis family transcriptional regulator [Skermanella stibiiresistens SB22]|uniref:Fis family transcriptional regulator n=1 Tax=Skermanella stibiiresistens SB22 TaxID=1385369 RepID=W9GYM8_9PROT|nr:sigma-54-dependent Fis family transcriptional regulator [Skermanella stibiiresistens]EWY37552.1 Fis family transcriptional regulator [Skermanella stibiiresistens SB22]
MPKTGIGAKQSPRSAIHADEASIMRAWEDFLAGVDDQPPVRNVVVNSWRRSLESGVDAHGCSAPLAVRDDGLHHLRIRNRDLLTAAAGTLAEAIDLFIGTGSIMLVTDPSGVVLTTVGDRATLEAGREIHLEPGGNWQESAAGTNGIGTALITRQPVLVHASEHFCAGVKSWTCAAAPIRDPIDGSLIGLLDISGPRQTFQRHNLALAVVAARQVEWAMADQARQERVKLLEACVAKLPTWVEDGIIAVDRKGRVLHVSDRARTLLEHGSGPTRLVLDKESRITSLDTTGWPAEWMKPLDVDGENLGALLVIPAKPRRSSAKVPAARHEGDPGRDSFAAIVGASPAVRVAVDRARRLAGRRAPVLIEGETGTGKELFARAIHGESAVSPSDPFIAFNCGAVSKELVASELFGYVRGAFTGAASEGRLGRFELADGGTLCLDEIGELPLDLQPYLLRVLEEGIVYRVGDSEPRRVNVRLIAMTNRNLRDEVAAGRFRQDLFYRISVTTVRIPPLRDREGDTDLLVPHFNQLLSRRHDLPPKRFEPAVLDALRHHSWPGNVRELRNVVESLLLMSDEDTITVADLPPDIAPPAPAEPAAGNKLETLERQAIETTIAAHTGNLTTAAKALGISRTTLYRKMEHYGLERYQ